MNVFLENSRRKTLFINAEQEILKKFKDCIVGMDIGATFSIFAVDGQTYRVSHSCLQTLKDDLLKIAENRKIEIFLEQTGRYSLPVIETFLDVAGRSRYKIYRP